MTRVSVLLNTYRYGGLDISFPGLAEQTMKDFEVILCDVYYDERKDAVAEYAKKFPNLPLHHIKPSRDQFPLDSGSKHRNSAVMYADGELAVFLCDYAHVRRDFVERHWNAYGGNPRQGVMAPHRYLMHPPVRPDWWRQPIGIFEGEMSPQRIMTLPMQAEGQDPKLGLNPGVISGDYMHLKNESVPMELLLEINGLDEGYDVDGGHCYSDSDLGLRCQKAGLSFILDRDNVADIVQVRDFYPILQRNRTTEADQSYFEHRKTQGAVASEHNNFSLRELRAKMLEVKHA